MANTPKHEAHSPTLTDVIYEKIKKQIKEVLPKDAVTVERGAIIDEYTDMKGNILKDGPFSLDGIICINGAKPNSDAVSAVLKQLKDGKRVSETSNAYTFDGSTPIATACNAALKAPKAR